MEWIEDPNDELARELRWGPGAELRAEAEITELETHQGRLRRRTIHDLARQSMNRGDVVTVDVGGTSVTGSIDAVGSDYMVITTASAVVDVAFESVVLRFARSSARGRSTRPGSATLKARLAEYEQTGETVRVVAPEVGIDTTGRVRVAAVDHVIVEDQQRGEMVIPYSKVALIFRPRPS